MIALIDLDSVLYKAVYKVVSITQMRQAIALHGKEGAKQWLYEEVYEQGINRVEKQVLEMLEHLESVMFEEISSTELYITTCTNSFRKKLSTGYKSDRKKNNYVWLLRNHYMINDAKFSDTLEADDLIAIRAKELGHTECIVVSIDKDLKTIGGLYWSYYKEDQYDFEGNVLLDDNGFKEKDFKQREPIYISQKEADLFFWQQVLSGDKGDCIDGINAITATHKKEILKERGVKVACRVGIVTAEKILADSTNHFIRVAREYIIRGQKNQFKLNYSLLKLGSIN
jgi:hypothetical protein